MDGKNYSAVPPPPSLSSDAKPLDFNSALSKARAIAEKLKQQTSAPVGGDTAPVTSASSSSSYQTGSKRSYDDNQDDYRSSSSSQRSYEDERSSKRSAYDGGSSRPLHEPRRYGLGSEERRGNGECSVPNNMVGLIIGKNGENLKKIERMSGCKVQFSDDNGESERKVRLSGEQDQIKIACDMIQQMISDASAANNGNNNNMFNKDPRFSANESQIIKIPSSKVGLVIGRKGETIRDFEERSKAKILMASDGSADKDNERIITLVGDNNAIQHAKKLIEDILYGSENNNFHGGDNRRFGQQGAGGPDFGGDAAGGGRYGRGRPNEEHESIRVPVKYVGLIIGKRGETIRTLQEQSGARIKIDNGDGSGDERIVNIFGEPSKVAFAKKLVEDKVAEGAANNAMGGGGRFGGGGNHHYQQHQQHHNNRGGYRQYNYGNYQEGGAPGGDGAENNNNYDYSQYNQYYAQYGYDQYGQQQQQQQQQGDNQGYQQQYPGYQYGQSYEGYGGATSTTDGTQQQQQKEDVAKAATSTGSGTSNGEKEAGGVDAAYYGQYYANQTPEQQEAYYQWYQQYYGGNGASGQEQQQYNNYDQQQQQQNDNGSSSASPPPPPPPPSSSATATAPPPASEDSEEKTDNTKDE